MINRSIIIFQLGYNKYNPNSIPEPQLYTAATKVTLKNDCHQNSIYKRNNNKKYTYITYKATNT